MMSVYFTIASLRRFATEADQPVSSFRNSLYACRESEERISERKRHWNNKFSSVLSNPKFAPEDAAKYSELRIRDAGTNMKVDSGGPVMRPVAGFRAGVHSWWITEILGLVLIDRPPSGTDWFAGLSVRVEDRH